MAEENTLTLIPEGMFSTLKENIFRAVIFSQKDRVKDLVLTIVDSTHRYTVAWVNDNWDGIFDQLAKMMGMTLIPQCNGECQCERYACAFDPNAELVPESTTESIPAFVFWLLPIIVQLFRS
ncbi:MAG: hypothetical protein FWD31_12120 [Planctomycetaceae bacterium]|nr:hypothetical protein [Planctomycetaceae bacterium]